jgi:hypothetical protein
MSSPHAGDRQRLLSPLNALSGARARGAPLAFRAFSAIMGPPMRIAGRLFALLLLSATLALQARPQVDLHLPHDGASLKAGSTAVIDWSGRALPRGAEEWEAFLSIDGGHYYGYRITPHLSIERRRFAFQVPDFETKNARILIRVGDEHTETEFVLPGSFTIWRDAAADIAAPPLTVVESERGEPGRAGAPGVIQWVEGDRQGQHLALRTALRKTSTLRGRVRSSRFDEQAVEGAPDHATIGIAENRESRRAIPRGGIVPTGSAHRAQTGRHLLLLSRRLNV